MTQCSTEALVLRSVDYGDTDRIVTLFTKTLGKLGVIARGARRSKKRFAGVLEPYTVLTVGLRLGRGELAELQHAHIDCVYSGVMRALDKMLLAGAALECVREAVPARTPEPLLYDKTVHLLASMHSAPRVSESWLIAFKAQVMAAVGWTPRFDGCGRCGKQPGPSQPAMFDPHNGVLVCRACGGAALMLEANTRRFLNNALSNQDMQALSTFELSAPQLWEARTAMAAFMQSHIGYVPKLDMSWADTVA